MSTVYVDVLVTVNIFIDLMMLLCVKRFLNIRARLIRIIAGSVLGGILSLSALLPRIPTGLNIALDVIFAALIVFTAFGRTDIKTYIKRTAVYFSVSFLFCGVMIFIYTAFKPDGMGIFNDVVYFDISPVLLIILTLVSYYILRLIKRLTKGDLGKRVCNVEVWVNGGCASFQALVDTGCAVKEPFSSSYVIIADKSLLSGLELNKSKMRVIPFSSLGGNGIIKGYPTDEVKIDDKKTENIYIGVSENILKGEIRALVPYEIIRM